MDVAVACGGTGGHLLPGLATAAALRDRGHDVTLWLSGRAIESSAAEAWSGRIVTIPAQPVVLHPLRLLPSLLAQWRAYRVSLAHLRARRPAALLAMGSYTSLGPVLAARRAGVPVVVHEANTVPGRAVTLLARWADAVAISFDESRQHLAHPNVVLTGLPLRRELEVAAAALPAPTAAGRTPTVLVMGGSQGARFLNHTAPPALAAVRAAGLPVQAIHLSGPAAADEVRALYAQAQVPSEVHGFLADMPSAYRRADLAICRSGAGSCFELALFGVPALLVPLPTAVRNHQAHNARAMEAAGSAVCVEQETLDAATLAARVRECLGDPDGLTRMRQAARAVPVAGAAQRLAELVENRARPGA
jgi:UDP-N-acetylglucosamine--N-acetylmuramyl-(pentapeptide) pyrophosphoryl-undecaprenol N-acetylglucosamine transferase